MRPLALAVAALFVSSPALAAKKGVAEKKTGLRLKVTQNLFDLQDDWAIFQGDEGDRTRTQTLGLLNPQSGRTEVTYLLGSGIEVGGIVGLQQQATSVDGDSVDSSTAWELGVTGAYNIPVSDTARIFIQPMVGISRLSAEEEGVDEVRSTQGLVFGIASGARVRLFKRVTMDPQLEYTRRNFTYAVDGDANEDLEGRQQNFGIRWGLTVLL